MRHKEWKMGTMVERIQPVEPSNLLNNMVRVFANMGNTLPPSNLRTPFGARHESTALCRWGVFHPKKIETTTTCTSSKILWANIIFNDGAQTVGPLHFACILPCFVPVTCPVSSSLSGGLGRLGGHEATETGLAYAPV